ncbi:MAG: hypothetical protein QOD06_1701 [Candidatus Binatota bacterium]|jgi:uncharacterized protein (DUF983 family)|nr:hypothetical protein [Candidatus Binatota bacterium]
MPLRLHDVVKDVVELTASELATRRVAIRRGWRRTCPWCGAWKQRNAVLRSAAQCTSTQQR